MKPIFYILFIVMGSSYAQVALQNFGNLQMHQDAEVGFHIDLINNGTFNENLGIAGFYSTTNSLSISGSEIPRFYDVEVDVVNHLFIDINTEITNSIAYITGDVVTPRDNSIISLDFLPNALFILEDDFKNTDGYVSFSGSDTFSFPIGDDDKLRPLITTNAASNSIVKAAYFNEDPNFPSTFPIGFDTDVSEALINTISIFEFWDFDGPENSIVTLTWNQESDINNLVTELQSLRVVGWHTIDAEWKDLGNSGTNGTLTEGSINSFVFNPSQYDVLTFGSLVTEDELVIYNLFSPNGDGDNDTFVIEGIESRNNKLTVYNRWGNVVFQATNYQNDWDGTSNAGRVIARDQKLPAGTYFYTLELTDENKDSTGWLYINY